MTSPGLRNYSRESLEASVPASRDERPLSCSLPLSDAWLRPPGGRRDRYSYEPSFPLCNAQRSGCLCALSSLLARKLQRIRLGGIGDLRGIGQRPHLVCILLRTSPLT